MLWSTMMKELVLPQYAVSIKKIWRIRAYTSPDTTKDLSLIRRIQEQSICRIQDLLYMKLLGIFYSWSPRQVIQYAILSFSIRHIVFREPPYPFDYPMRRLTMEEILAKFIDEVKGVTTRGGKMTSEATGSKEINETGINKNEPPRFEQDVQEKPHDDGVENKSLTLLQIPKYAKYLKSLLTNESRLEEACTEIMNERCSAVLFNELPLKKDLGSFTIPCQVLEKHKETKDLAADHTSRLENPHMEVLTEREVADEFYDEHLMALKPKSNNDEPWYADFVNYIVGKEPYEFKLCVDNIMRRCVAGSKTLEILAHCHSGPTSGHHSANVTAKKVYESGFFWPSVFKDANEYALEDYKSAGYLGKNILQKDLNLKFLRSLPSEWNTHVVVWRNKPDLDTMSFDDLYNNFKIVEQEIKRTASSS
ncbi:hypothetical protein Tco_0729296 [Tanacetum coccineum]|uniref:Reverse transcriptase domain-containing protein n=1 Tax=Tanacetum coccineum TaxID=301880 RepID=A0ABQ4YPF3_9ASTR